MHPVWTLHKRRYRHPMFFHFRIKDDLRASSSKIPSLWGNEAPLPPGYRHRPAALTGIINRQCTFDVPIKSRSCALVAIMILPYRSQVQKLGFVHLFWSRWGVAFWNLHPRNFLWGKVVFRAFDFCEHWFTDSFSRFEEFKDIHKLTG